jgi:nudix-type nucleoside diphosphatase (YffH/AdpP family)
MTEIENEQIVYNKKLVIEEAQLIGENNKKFSRLRLIREDAAAVLVINTDSNKVILTKQFRYPVAAKASEEILEIVAGKLDEGEEPMAAALRETEEEIGYRIKPKNIKLLVSCFASPGYSSERFFIYTATVTDEDKVSKGGGLAAENEQIEIIELDVDKFKTLIRDGALHDAKTYIAGLHLMLQEEDATL